jgi:trehalose 6-phosphate synthase
MNLVAKEYVASQVEGDGVLLLSRFAGAAESMGAATLINPYDPEDLALRIRDALQMPAEQRQENMRSLNESMHSIYDWMRDVFSEWGAITEGRNHDSSAA